MRGGWKPAGTAAWAGLLLAVLAFACGAVPELETRATPATGTPAAVPSPAAAEGAAAGSGTSAAKEHVQGSSPPLSAPARTPAADTLGPEDLETLGKGDPVLARVGGEAIHASDLWSVYFMDNPMKFRDVLENQVLLVLVRKEAARLGIRVEKAVVDRSLERLLRDQQGLIAYRLDEKMRLEAFVRDQYGMDMEAYRALMGKTALFHVLLSRCVRYRELQVRRLRIGVIVVKEREKAGEIRDKLLKGASFDVLARENSVDPSRAVGGILPPLPADLDHPVVKEALPMAVGEVSAVKETDLGKGEKGYRILKLIEVLEPVKGSYAELADAVKKSLEEDPLVPPDLVRYWRNSLEDRYAVEYHLSSGAGGG